ncbi:hypothetical protein J4223_03915 [Candidatus Woesearchaeota archaeon]|nr:hypothetical protein [Candidatus Woesearchaeota archaeon]
MQNKELINNLLYTRYSEDIMNTTIQLDKKLVKELQEARDYPRQTYNELIEKMLKLYKNTKKRNQYDEFLHKIQQQKMKELWDNKEDEVWEDA